MAPVREWGDPVCGDVPLPGDAAGRISESCLAGLHTWAKISARENPSHDDTTAPKEAQKRTPKYIFFKKWGHRGLRWARIDPD